MASLLKRGLEREGYAVDIAATGKEALWAGQEFPYDALVLMIEGDAEISIAGTAHAVGAGKLLRLPGSQPHAVKALTRIKMILVMIRA